MSKQKIIIEKELKSNSLSIIWQFLSTAEGLSRWFANDVQLEGKKLKMIWGDAWRNHEVRQATIIRNSKNQIFRFRWDDEEDKECVIEFRIEKSEITNDYILVITDYAEEEELDSAYELWEDDLERLHQSSGL